MPRHMLGIAQGGCRPCETRVTACTSKSRPAFFTWRRTRGSNEHQETDPPRAPERGIFHGALGDLDIRLLTETVDRQSFRPSPKNKLPTMKFGEGVLQGVKRCLPGEKKSRPRKGRGHPEVEVLERPLIFKPFFIERGGAARIAWPVSRGSRRNNEMLPA